MSRVRAICPRATVRQGSSMRAMCLSLLVIALVPPCFAQGPANEPILCDPATHPKLPVRRADALSAAFDRGDFDEVEKILDEVQATPRLRKNFIGRFVDYQDETLAGKPLASLETWVARKPRSSRALACRAASRVEWAWQARGNSYADQVPQSAWKVFGERLELARQDVQRAMELDPKNAFAPAVGVKVAMGLSLGRDQAEAYVAAAEAADPTEFEAHLNMLTFLLPRWFGEPGELLAWARRKAAAAPHKNLHWVVAQAHGWVALDEGPTYWDRPEVNAELTASYEAVLEDFPQSIFVRAQLAGHLRRIHGDLVRVEALMQDSVDDGSMASAVDLGRLLLNGGLPRDELRAARLFCRAAHGGQPEGMAELADVLVTGTAGVTIDVEAARAWVGRASEATSIRSNYIRGAILSESGPAERAAGASLLVRAARAGDHDAQALLGRLRIERGERLGLTILERAVADGSRRARLELGTLLVGGPGSIPADPPRAAQLLREALAQGDRRARPVLVRLLGAHPDLRQVADPK